MSSQAGVFYHGKRTISEEQAAIVINSLADGIHSAPRRWSSGGVFLGYADFAYLTGSQVEVQPYVTPHGAITFDGRLDNREDLILLLHHDLRGDTCDAALALAVYRRNGIDGLRSLIGDWSLTIWDTERQLLVLASDFAGARPLYYYSDANRVLWSTQLKPLVEWIRPDSIDDQYVAGLLAHACYPDFTPYPGIFSLRPGHCLVRSRDGVEIRPFWRPPINCTIRYRNEADYEERLRELFRDAVRSRLRTNFPVISELSGGLDSSSIVCMAWRLMMQGAPMVSQRFVTLSYERHGSLDERFCTAVENWTGFEHIHLSTAEYAFLSEDHPGEALPTFWSELNAGVAAEARKIGARTLITGLSGDLLMGNFGDDSDQVSGLLRAGHIRRAFRQSLAWSRSLRMPVGAILWRALLLLLPTSLIGAKSDLFSDGGGLAGNKEDSITPAFRARTGLDDAHRFFSPIWMEAPPERRKLIRGLLQTIELRRFQPPEELTHLNYTHPYAHRPLVDYMLSIPPEIVCRPGEPRWLMRRAFRHFWPPELTHRRSKDTFGGVFLDALRPLVPALMKEVRQLQVVQRGYIDPVSLTSRLERLTHSLDCNAAQLRRVILLELWLRRRINPQIV
jgi:asparagine synthase (glutamine-hydrolysing)